MSKMRLESRKFGTKIVDDTKEFFNKLWKRSMAEIDLDHMEVEDIQLLKETSKLFKSVLNETEDYIDVINYQLKLLENIEDKLEDMDDRLKRLEAKN